MTAYIHPLVGRIYIASYLIGCDTVLPREGLLKLVGNYVYNFDTSYLRLSLDIRLSNRLTTEYDGTSRT